MVGDVLLGSAKVFGSRFLGFVTGDVKIFKGDFFYLSRVLLNGSQADPFFFLFACRMAKGYEEVSNSQVGRWRGAPWETPTTSNLAAAMSVEELRLNNQVPAEINLEMSDNPATSTIGRQIMPFTSLESSLLLGFASPSHRW